MKEKKALTHCRNCDQGLSSDFKYCPNCSQRIDDFDESISGLFQHFLTDYFTFDSKLGKSIKPLFFQPGKLTLDHLEGKRVRYIPPLRMYIFVSLIFFLVLGWKSGLNHDLDSFFGSLMPKIFFFLLPIFALFLALLFKKRKLALVHHLVFALHFHAFVFIGLLGYLLLSQVGLLFGNPTINLVLLSIFLLGFLVYLYLALKRVYAFSHGRLILRFLSLLLMYGGVITIITLVVLAVGTLSQNQGT